MNATGDLAGIPQITVTGGPVTGVEAECLWWIKECDRGT